MFVARRRRRTGPALLSVGLIAAMIAWAGTDLSPFGGGADQPAPATAPAQGTEGTSRAMQATAAETPLLATFGPLDLHLTTARPLIVGFHEASTPDALEMRPAGRVTDNENTTKFEPPEELEGGSDYLVMSSRGRPRPATSAVDVVMRTGDPVVSPVSGTVTDVRTYFLYGKHEDHRVEIAPHDQPDLRVVLIHIDELEVAVGDDVDAGQSVLAGTARPFPFSSQVDRYTEPDRWPHVHIEVKVADDEDAEPHDHKDPEPHDDESPAGSR
jgi:biotin carboxyl carrier protein